MAEPLFIAPYFMDYILPFVLVFTLIFAMLQKTKLFGDDTKQIDALIAGTIGLILIAFPYARGIVVLLTPFLAVSAVILLVFMLLYGFISGKTDGDILGKGWKNTLIAVVTIALVIFLLKITGYWNNIGDIFLGENSQYIWVNIILIVVIIGAVIAVLWEGGSGSGSGGG